MQVLQQILFLAILGIAAFLVFKRAKRIINSVMLGKDIYPQGSQSERIRRLLLFAFGQKKMFAKPGVGIMHFIIYAGFIIINIEVLEIILDGLLGTHRLFTPVLGGLYPVLLNFFELLAFGVLAVCVVFLVRRNVMRIARFKSPELNGWPLRDANIILTAEIVLMMLLFSMNAADAILQQRGVEHYQPVGSFLISQFFVPILDSFSTPMLIFTERTCWWLHIMGILSFAVYVTYSKHLHIFMAFPNIWYGRQTAAGKLDNMPFITNEVNIALGLIPESAAMAPEGKFGAKDITDLNRKHLMDAYSCTECGRCTSQCPANLTGKKLSPRKIMMDTRDRLEYVADLQDKGQDPFSDGKSLLGDHITKEEIMACTSCNACVEACPVNINPLDIIVELRRYVAMEESATPASWNAMFSNTENNAAPWAFSPTDRANWIQKVNS